MGPWNSPTISGTTFSDGMEPNVKTCLVNLISDQTIPNIIVTCHFRPDFLLLISTDEMERKRKSIAILETLKLRGLDYTREHEILRVQQHSIVSLEDTVSGWLRQVEGKFRFVVNLTGGTKLMTIAAYDLFKDFGSEMVYVPIPKNEHLVPFPKRRPGPATPMTDRLSVAEYLTAYGFEITNQASLKEGRENALLRKETTGFLFDHYREIKPILYWLYRELQPVKRPVKGQFSLCGDCPLDNEIQRTFLKKIGFQAAGRTITGTVDESLRKYVTGGWLEESIFMAASAVAPSGVDVQLGVMYRDMQQNTNELDVLFTQDNVIHVVECKSLDAREGNDQDVGGTINDFLYKLGALRQQFGLTPKAFLATTSQSILNEVGEIRAHHQSRSSQLGITIIPLLKIADLREYFQKEVFGRGEGSSV
jgi:hypothetical protein